MKLSEFKHLLSNLETLHFRLENGHQVPVHFHVTEVGMFTKKFIDCGGNLRTENYINFQLWYAHDYEHRLNPSKLLKIIELSERKLDLIDTEIEVEYQSSDTIGKYSLDFEEGQLVLKNKQTNCLAEDFCGITPIKKKVQLSELGKNKVSIDKTNSKCC